MSEMNEILGAAGKLGALISGHPAINNYKEVARQLELDVAAKNIMMQYEQLIERLSQKEAAMQPIEIAEKQHFEQLQQSIAMQPTIKRFAQAQQDYMELMKKVQETINLGISGQLPPEIANATGTPPAPVSKIILDT